MFALYLTINNTKLLLLIAVVTLTVMRSTAIKEAVHVGGHYTVQDHSRSLILVQLKACMQHPIS